MDDASPDESIVDSGVPPEMRRWSRTRDRGRRYFLWVHGVLGWGVPVAVCWSIAMAWGKGWERFLQLIMLAMIGFPIGGYFWGALVWRNMEKKYQASVSGDPE